MTGTHGEGVYGNGAGVVTPLDHKMAQLGHVVKTAANTIRAGLFWDGSATVVSGKANMSYDVRALTCVLSRGAASGAVFLSNDAVYNVATTAAPGSNSRYDVVYIWQREYSLDGTNSDPVIGVVQGTAAASPTVPSLAAFPGAIELARILVPSGVTATNSGTTITQTATFTATAGGVIPFRNTTERDAGSYVESQLGWLIDTDVLQSYSGSTWTTVGQSALTPVIPTSVAAGSGTATVGAGGKVTFTTVGTSLSVNGCFTSAYDNYTIKLEVNAKTVAVTFRLRSAVPADDATSNYDQKFSYFTSGAATSTDQAATTFWYVATGTSTEMVSTINVNNPALAQVTRYFADSDEDNATAIAVDARIKGRHRSATAFPGFSLLIASGTMTGNLRIYGWNNN